MVTAVCFRCGTDKGRPFDACPSCRSVPHTDEEQSISFVLSSLYSSPEQLSGYRAKLKGGKPVVPLPASMNEAREALKDPQLISMLGGRPNAERVHPSQTQQAPRTAVPAGRFPMAPRKPKSRSIETSLHRSAFFVLGATVRDDRKRIVQLAEEKSLEIDHGLCQKARTDLTSPRNRLTAEVAWFPGVAPRKATELMDRISGDPASARKEAGLPVLAHLNFLAAAFEAIDVDLDDEEFVLSVEQFAQLADDLDPDDVLRDINEDRTVSGFPEVSSANQVEAEIDERRRYYQSVIKKALERKPAESIVRVMTMLVDRATGSGEEHASRLVDDLVDSYEIESQGFLEKEAENVRKLVAAIRKVIGSGESAAAPLVDRLEAVARNWDRVAQPIQLNAMARGINHDPSRSLAYEIRSLAIDLFNDHDMLAQSQRITALLQDIFSEVPDVAERLEQDSDALADVFENRKKASASKVEWGNRISYSAEIGVLFKDTLKISPEGITWKNRTYPLESITRVRWGGIRRSVNGVPTGSTFTIAFGDEHSESVVELKRENVYSTFIDKLWQAVGIRLLVEMLQALRAGSEFPLGGGILHDDGVTVVKHKFLSSNTSVKCPWTDLQTWSSDGNFYIGSKSDKKAYIGLSYLSAANAHIIEQAIRMAFKKPGLRRLSELLQ